MFLVETLRETVLLAPILLVGLAALVIHEYAHARTAYLLGDPTAAERGRMTLNPLAHLDPLGTLLLFVAKIGWARPVPVSVYRLKHGYVDMGLVAAAGPASNVAMAVLSAALFYVLEPLIEIRTEVGGATLLSGGVLLSLVANLLFWSVFLNLNLAFFNLIPIPPLDGSNILRAFLPPRFAWMSPAAVRWGGGVILGVVLLGRWTEFDPLLRFLAATTGPACRVLIGVDPFA